MSKPKTDPLIRGVKKARSEWRKTLPGQLDKLMFEERKWRRRCTIANNKHDQAVIELTRFALALVKLSDTKP